MDDIAAREAREARRAQSPMAIRFEVIGCEFATMVFPEERMIPIYQFHPPCPFNKTVPDQDCRSCRHHNIRMIGTNEPYWRNRFYGYGAVFPIPDEATADAVIEVLETHDALPLRRPVWEPETQG